MPRSVPLRDSSGERRLASLRCRFGPRTTSPALTFVTFRSGNPGQSLGRYRSILLSHPCRFLRITQNAPHPRFQIRRELDLYDFETCTLISYTTYAGLEHRPSAHQSQLDSLGLGLGGGASKELTEAPAARERASERLSPRNIYCSNTFI